MALIRWPGFNPPLRRFVNHDPTAQNRDFLDPTVQIHPKRLYKQALGTPWKLSPSSLATPRSKARVSTLYQVEVEIPLVDLLVLVLVLDLDLLVHLVVK